MLASPAVISLVGLYLFNTMGWLGSQGQDPYAIDYMESWEKLSLDMESLSNWRAT